jgi:CubicO group peptidase (beta-lactamase class C family)
MRLTKYLCSLLIIAFAITSLNAQTDKIKGIDTLMNAAHQAGVFNGTILIAENGKTIYQSSFGFADAKKATNLTKDYRFNIGSISKEFNGVAIMILKEQGKLRLDDKVSKYLTDLPAWADKISIKNLLQYTSGLPNINWKTIKTDTDILNDLKQLKQLNSEPGTVYDYNNTNVFLQRRIVEKITGSSFQRFVETKILKPCKMSDSVVDPNLKGKNVAVSFNNDYVENPRQFSYVMSGWVSVTANDLFKWSECVEGGNLISLSSFREILIPFLPNKQSSLGGGIMEGSLIKEHVHQGSSFDFEALMYSAPSERISIILLTNNMNFKLYEIKDAIKSILKDEPYKTPKKSTLFILKNSDNLSAEEIIKLYNDTKATYPSDYDFNPEADFNLFGYMLMNKNRLEDAIKLFEMNVKNFPASANAYDSLGEALFKQGNKKLALLNYKKSLELNPQNAAAKEMIEKLENER